ncbi:hypothetical protein D3C81_1431570 [compost metagenome]
MRDHLIRADHPAAQRLDTLLLGTALQAGFLNGENLIEPKHGADKPQRGTGRSVAQQASFQGFQLGHAQGGVQLDRGHHPKACAVITLQQRAGIEQRRDGTGKGRGTAGRYCRQAVAFEPRAGHAAQRVFIGRVGQDLRGDVFLMPIAAICSTTQHAGQHLRVRP